MVANLATPTTYGAATVAVVADAVAPAGHIPWLSIVMGTVAVVSMLVNWYYKQKEYKLKLEQHNQ